MAENKNNSSNSPKVGNKVIPKPSNKITPSGTFKGSENGVEKSFHPRSPLPPKK